MLMILPRPRDHPPRHRLRHIEDARDIGPQQLVPLVVGEVLERRAELHPGVVDQDVDRPRSLDLRHTARHSLGVGHVEDRDLRPVAGLAERRGHRIEPRGRAAVQDHLGAVRRETFGEGQPDPLA
jgi:hypothetical protein